MLQNLAAGARPASSALLRPRVSRRAFMAGAAGLLAGARAAWAAPRETVKAGWGHVTPLTDAGWTHQHDQGRKAVEASLGARVSTRFVENVPEGADAERVIRDLVADGCDIVFTPSFGYMEPTLRVAADSPRAVFESITGYKRAPNVATANARYYEGRYLAGIAAARAAKSGVAGYVAGFPIPEVLQGVNAFARGMRSVNPDAQVRLVWLNAWFDPPREREAAMTLMNQGAEVLAFHTASNAVMVAAQERGRLAVAYHSDMRRVAPQAQLLAVTHEWGAYYTRRVKAVLDGTWTSTDTWGGVREGMVRVGDFGPRMTAPWQAEIEARQRDIASGRVQPFHAGASGARDNQGRIVIAADKALSDEQILGMNWLAEGVQGTLPKG